MIPTNELRFVEREEKYLSTFNVFEWKTVRVLQQKWVRDYKQWVDEEWRDVPVEKETP